jgi:Mrp family chromosome partitioning ATPase
VPERHDPLSDSYRTLRSIISFVDGANPDVEDRGAIVLVVSPGPGDGKTSLTANLTAAFVEAGNRTVAVNTDFRRPTLTRRMAMSHPEPIGFELHEIEHAPLELVLTQSPIPRLSALDLSPMKGHSPGDLARVTARLLPRIADASDVVVVDTSPVGATAEVLEFVPKADTIVMVVKLGHTSIQAAKRAIETVRALTSANIVLALMGGDAHEAGYYYSYSSTEPRPAGLFGRKRQTVPEDRTVRT